MHVLTLIAAHQTAIALAAGWLYSSIMSSMPPISPTASYGLRWLHDAAQALAANWDKHSPR